jgi:Ca2+-binding EF-hand superfamily protein
MKTVTITLVSALILSGAGVAALAQAATPNAMASAIFSKLDADQDGAVTMAEMAEHKTAQFTRADRNSDGIVDPTEMAAIRDRMAKRVAAAKASTDLGLSRLDSDGDAALSLAEYTARTPIFVLMDGDGDGAITRSEFDRVRAAIAN